MGLSFLSYCFNHCGCTSYLTLAVISSYFILNLIWQSPKTLFDEMESQQFMIVYVSPYLDNARRPKVPILVVDDRGIPQ